MPTDRPASAETPQDVAAPATSSVDFGRRQWFSDAQRQEIATDVTTASSDRDPKFLDGVTARKFFTVGQRADAAAGTDAPRNLTAISTDTQH